ncbi:MAG: hypothetical protein ACRDKT_01840 [Actinomycetota bacterium]
MKALKIFLVAAALAVPTSVVATPASATCHPEKPSTCEFEYPPTEPCTEGFPICW